MIALCPSCWQVVPPTADRCAACGADFGVLQEREYSEKLRSALDHPDRETVIRVAGILAARRDAEAIPALVAALKRHWIEPYVAAAIVEALGQLDDPAARAAAQEALGHESLIVRAKAALVLQRGSTGAPAVD